MLTATTDTEIDMAFATLAQEGVGALMVCADPFFDVRRERIVALAIRHRVPAIYHWREYVAIGGLLSYGASLTQSYREAGIYAGRILKGTKPTDLNRVGRSARNSATFAPCRTLRAIAPT